MASGTVSITPGGEGPSRRIVIDWTSAADETFNGFLTHHLRGEIMRVVFLPGSGDDQPSASYDLTLEDENGIDVLQGQGSDLSNSIDTDICPGLVITDGTYTTLVRTFIDDTLELKGTGCGISKSGSVVIYMD